MESRSTQAPEAQNDRVRPGPAMNAGFEQIWRHLAELREFAAHFVAAKLDAIKMSVRLALVYGVLAVIGLFVGVAVVGTSAVLLCVGVAGGLGRFFGSPWLGNLVTGLLILGLVAAGAWLAVASLTKSFKQKTKAAYEARAARQRAAFGEDARERARKTKAI